MYGAIALLVLIGGYFYFSSKNSNTYKTFTVVRTSIEDKVSFAGNVIPAEKVVLSFEKTGRIVSLPAYVGKRVTAGEVLATLSSGDSQALLEQAQASLMAEQATLAELKRGARPESIDVAKTRVSTAEITLNNNFQGLRDALSDAYTKADDAVHNTLDPLYSNDASIAPIFIVSIPDSQLKNTIENLRATQEKTLALWRVSNDAGYPNLTPTSLASIEKSLLETKSLLDSVASAMSTAQSGGTVTQTNLDTWRPAVGVARTTISASINKLNLADQAYTSSAVALTLAKQDLQVLLAGSSDESIASEVARVASAQAKVSQYQVEVNKGVLYSPIDGVVSTKDTELGQIVSPNQQIVSVISNKNFQIESNVSELDIGKLVVGMFATTTLDAYGTDVPFLAKVIRIDPAETTVENSPAYGVRLEFIAEDSRVKSGMTANITIVIAHRDGALAVPIRTIKKEGGVSAVNVLALGKSETRTITTGIVSPSGLVEVLSGLNENDHVILPQGL